MEYSTNGDALKKHILKFPSMRLGRLRGIENELEGIINFPDSRPEMLYWAGKGEGSLRGGMELYTVRPVAEEALPEVYAEFDEIMKVSTPSSSIRTSLHIHFNMAGRNAYEILQIIATWWLVENALVSLNGRTREGNLFCLRVRDAENIPSNLIWTLRSNLENLFSLMSNDWKYAALNIGALAQFGTLEFRFMNAAHNSSEIKKWLDGLSHFIDKVVMFESLDAILDFLADSPNDTFLKHFLSAELYKEVCLRTGEAERTDAMLENYCHVIRLQAFLQEPYRKYAYIKPNTDIDESPQIVEYALDSENLLEDELDSENLLEDEMEDDDEFAATG